MNSAKVLKHAVLGLVMFCIGFLLYPIGGKFWGVLLEYIAWPESRWGAEGSRFIGQALKPLAYFLLVAGISVFLTFISARLSIRYSYLVSSGALMSVTKQAWYAGAPFIWVAQNWKLEGFFFILLPPLLAMLTLQIGWLTRRSNGMR